MKKSKLRRVGVAGGLGVSILALHKKRLHDRTLKDPPTYPLPQGVWIYLLIVHPQRGLGDGQLGKSGVGTLTPLYSGYIANIGHKAKWQECELDKFSKHRTLHRI